MVNKTRTQKQPLGVGLSKTNAIAKKCAGFWAINEQAGETAYNIADIDGDGAVSNFDWVDGALSQSGDVGQVVALPSSFKPLEGASIFSVVAKIKMNDDSVDSGIFYTDKHAGFNPLLLWFDIAATNHFAALVSSPAMTTGGLYSNFVPVIGVDYIVALIRDSSFVRMYINGIEDTGGDFPYAFTGGLLSTTTQYNFCNDTVGFRPLRGAFKWGYLSKESLTPKEIHSFANNPWQVIEPKKIYFDVGAAGGDITGDIASTFPTFQIDISGFQGIFGTVGITTPTFSVAINGVNKNVGSIGVVMPTFEVDIVGVKTHVGAVGSVFKTFVVDITGKQGSAGDIEVVMPTFEVSIDGVNKNVGNVAVVMPTFEVSIEGVKEHVGAVESTFKTFNVAINGLVVQDLDGDIEVVMPMFLLNIKGTVPVKRKGGTPFKNDPFKNRPFKNDVFDNPPLQ